MAEPRALYIVLTDTGTWLSRAIGRYTGRKLNHASLAFDAQLLEVYSFGRKEPHNPFIGGFVKENLRGAWFMNRRRGEEVGCAVYRLGVPQETYRKVRRYVDAMERLQHRYKYNLLGLLGVAANIPLERKRAFFCSQFVAAALAAGGIRIADKPPSLTTPQDFENSNRGELLYRGPLSGYFKRIRSPKRSQVCYNRDVSIREDRGEAM